MFFRSLRANSLWVATARRGWLGAEIKKRVPEAAERKVTGAGGEIKTSFVFTRGRL